MKSSMTRGGVAKVRAAWLCAASISGAAAAQPTFIPIDPFPVFGGTNPLLSIAGVSGDGLTVVGSSKYIEGNSHYLSIFRWTEAAGKERLAFMPGSFESIGSGVNADGTAFCGYSFLSGSPFYRAARWPTPSSVQSIAIPTGWGTSGKDIYPVSTAISADGRVVVGNYTAAGTGPYAFRSVDGGQMLCPLPGQTLSDTSSASGVSPDGVYVLGAIIAKPFPQYILPFRWSEANHFEYLPLLPGGTSAYVTGSSADNTTLVGYGGSSFGTQTILWINGVAVSLGGPEGSTGSYGTLISADGSRVAGYATYSTGAAKRAAFWANTGTYVNLNVFFPGLGIDLTGWVLTTVTGLSADGTAMAGMGTYNGVARGWYAKNIPAPCVSAADITHDFSLNLSDFFAFFNCFDTGDPCADIDGVPGVDLGDFFAFFGAFDAGC